MDEDDEAFDNKSGEGCAKCGYPASKLAKHTWQSGPSLRIVEGNVCELCLVQNGDSDIAIRLSVIGNILRKDLERIHNAIRQPHGYNY